MRYTLAKWAVLPSLFLPLMAGCEAAVGPVVVGPADERGFEPGYYYDDEYVDVGGGYHPRDYWYHDGQHFSHRDGLPGGAPARARFGFVHGAAPRGGGRFEGGHR